MVARGAGAVGCAHCKMIGADRACAVCTRLVCPTCAADWATCEEPSGRVVRLGMTARVRDVDPTGRLAFVTHWRRAPRLFDLRQLRWVKDVELSRAMYLWNRKHPPRLTSDGRLLVAEWTRTLGTYQLEDSPHSFDGIRVHELGSSRSRMIGAEPPEHGTAVSAVNDRYYYVTTRQQVVLFEGSQTFLFEPLPRKVLHAVAIDGERDLLAAGSWSEVVLHRIVDGKLERSSHLKIERVGDVRWLAIAGPWLVLAISEYGTVFHIQTYELERDQSIGSLVREHTVAPFLGASLSRDGRYLAYATDVGLFVHETATGEHEVFTDHTDDINLVRFAGDDHVLISADTDNHVVMRPRTKTGYAKPLLAVDVPDEPVPLTLPTPSERGPH